MVTNNKILLRFLVLFVVLLTVPFPLNTSTKLEFISESILKFYQKIITGIGENVFNLESSFSITQTGSGDKTFDYLLLLLLLITAVFGTIIWSIADKKNRSYENMNYWLLVLTRYYLGYFMIYYGLFKIMPIQFGEISFWKMLQPYGESSPMGLAWTFLGHSKGYSLFMGLSEFIGGILLFHRRTKLLGALILIPVIVNVVAVNFFFDVPVKLFSSVLLLMAFIVVAPDLKRLLNLIIFNKPTYAVNFASPFQTKKWVLWTNIVKWLFVLFILYNTIDLTMGIDKIRQNKPELFGLYEVTTFVSNKDTIQPLLTDDKRWRYIFFEYPNSVQFSRMNKSRYGLNSEVDTLKKQIKLTEFKDSTQVYLLDFKKTDSTLNISGIFRKDTIFCKTKRLDRKDFRLTSRGFNWINERPYNR